jgi:hypothetical protein
MGVLALALGMGFAGAISDARSQTMDLGKYPDIAGGWGRSEVYQWARGEKPPLTPEYQAVLAASLADRATGGHGTDTMYRCFPPGMPRVMHLYSPMELVITPGTTYMLIDHIHDDRRIFTDGRDWPEDNEPTYAGYSIGKWIDTDGDGAYDTLEVETRGPFKGPRAYDATGLPLAFDNQSTFMERIYRDKADQRIMHDQITVYDHALTRPWTVDKKYVLDSNPRPNWVENYCTESPTMVAIGKESYFLTGDGQLMPVRKDQPPPDLRYFKPSRK